MYAYNYFYFWRVYWRHHDPLNNSRHVSWKQECSLYHSAVIKIRKCDFVTIQCLTLSCCSYFISFSSNILKAIFPLLLIQTRSVLCIYLSCLLNALQSGMCVSALLYFPEQALCSYFCRRSSSFNLHCSGWGSGSKLGLLHSLLCLPPCWPLGSQSWGCSVSPSGHVCCSLVHLRSLSSPFSLTILPSNVRIHQLMSHFLDFHFLDFSKRSVPNTKPSSCLLLINGWQSTRWCFTHLTFPTDCELCLYHLKQSLQSG